MAWLTLTPYLQEHVGFQGLVLTQYFYTDRLSGFFAPQCIREIVQVLNFLAVEFDENIASLETGLSGRGAFAHVGEADALGRLGEIGDAAEVRTVAGTARTGTGRRGTVGGRLRIGDTHKPRAFGVGRQASSQPRDEFHQSGAFLSVNLVPRVARFVVIAVKPRKEEENRNLFRRKRGVIGRPVAS